MQQLSAPNSRASQPLVTIAIPTRNRSALVRSSVLRALKQTYANIEVLVSDNASTDDTVTVLGAISDPRLRVVTNPENIGSTPNINKCVREARGDYIVIVPDDDRVAETFVEKCVELINREPAIQAVVGAYDVFFADENRRRPPILSERLSTGIFDGSEILKEFLSGRLATITLSTLTRTKLLRDIGGFDATHLTADDILVLTQVLLSGRCALLNESCATLTIHKSTVSTQSGFDYSFLDIQKVMVETSRHAERSIADIAERQEIQKLAAHYVAMKLFDFLALYRRQGASLSDVIGQFRAWAAQSPQCTAFDFLSALRPKTLALVLLPPSVTKVLLSLRHTLYGRGLIPTS